MCGRNKDQEYTKPIFKRHKNNLPKNHSSPAALKTFLNSVKSEIMDPKNRNEVKCNPPLEELSALKELIRLQKERVFIINHVTRKQAYLSWTLTSKSKHVMNIYLQNKIILKCTMKK